MSTMKPCTRCEKIKALEEFSIMRHVKSGRSSWCKICCREYGAYRRAQRILTNDYRIVKKKECATCKETKKASQFFAHHRSPDKLMSVCKACHTKDCNRARKKLKQDIIDGYGGKCACCNESRYEFLTLDHKDNDGGKHRKEAALTCTGKMAFGNATYKIYRQVRKAGYPKDRFQVLCFNCNCAKGIFGYCPHQKEREAMQCQSILRDQKDSS